MPKVQKHITLNDLSKPGLRKARQIRYMEHPSRFRPGRPASHRKLYTKILRGIKITTSLGIVSQHWYICHLHPSALRNLWGNCKPHCCKHLCSCKRSVQLSAPPHLCLGKRNKNLWKMHSMPKQKRKHTQKKQKENKKAPKSECKSQARTCSGKCRQWTISSVRTASALLWVLRQVLKDPLWTKSKLDCQTD